MRNVHPIAIVAALGVASCQFFSDVVVPSRDTTRPSALATFYDWDSGQHIHQSTLTISDPTRRLVALATTVDSGGAKRATMEPEVVARCIKGNVAVFAFLSFLPITQTQSGQVGSTVKNGVYAFKPARLSDYTNICQSQANATLDWIEFRWTADGEDFHGNQSDVASGALRYDP